MTTKITIDTPEIDLDVFIRMVRTITFKFWYIKKGHKDGKYILHFSEALTAQEVIDVNAGVSSYSLPAALSALDQLRKEAKESIDYAAGQARSRYITISPGQSGVYLRKAHDAQAYIDAAYPADDTPYKYVKAEKNAKNMSSQPDVTSQDVADGLMGVGGISEQWDTLAATIEEIRLGHKGLIDEATDETGIKNHAYNAIAILNNI